MSSSAKDLMQAVPSIDQLSRHAAAQTLLQAYGRELLTEALRVVTAALRRTLRDSGGEASQAADHGILIAAAKVYLVDLTTSSLRPVFNLTGTVLHTNLGRAPLPDEAIMAMTLVARGASNLEYDLHKGRRGDRDVHLESWICRLTGAEAATTVNNNAAAVMLVVNTLARRKEVIVSRGELIEIGGSFRIPEVMSRAGAKLFEVGTTNRTYRADYENSISAKTAMLMKVHTSNYVVEGFTAAVPERDLAAIAHAHKIPFVVDLGSGTLVDLTRFGLPHEPTVAETVAHGADIVTFSGDKLLGGPQAGIIAGRADLIDRIKRNPMKRALRVDKMTIAALAEVFKLYADPDRLAERSTTLRLLTRRAADIRAQAQRLIAVLVAACGPIGSVEVVACSSQIGSGAQPGELLESAGLALLPIEGRGTGKTLERIAAAFRALPIPVIGRIEGGVFLLDLRCLEDEPAFLAQLAQLSLTEKAR
jgi:L-seryl-tRNA(Ser) seleniumtransferase